MSSKTDVEKCTAADVGISITGKTPDAEREAANLMETLDGYFLIFAKPSEECFNCGAKLGGLAAAMMGTGFRWGVVHGEGNCGCGWPCRAYHRPKDGDGEIFDKAVQVILQYHPDCVTEKEPSNA